MKPLKLFTLILLFLSLTNRSTAQNFEAGLMMGTSFYWGDIQPQLRLSQPNDLHPAAGGFLKYHFNKKHALRINIQHGTISAADANTHVLGEVHRNLSFKSRISEVAIMYEVDLWNLIIQKESRIRPYFSAGLALFHHNPKALYNGEWYALQPLATEGQGTSQFPDRQPYALTDFSFPMGGGLQLSLSDKISVAAEINFHLTNTDYLDDISTTYPDFDIINSENGDMAAILSYRRGELAAVTPGEEIPEMAQRGNPETNDGYVFTSITLNYKFSNSSGKQFNGNKRKVKCYSFKNR